MEYRDIPNDVWDIIAAKLAVTDIFRDKYDVMRDVVMMYTANKVAFRHLAYATSSIIARSKVNKVAFVWNRTFQETLECGNANALKDLCKLLQIPSSGTKSILIGRLKESFSKRYRIINDQNTISDLESLRYKSIGVYSAKIIFGLNKQDLSQLDSDNKGYFKYREVRDIAQQVHKNCEQLQTFLDQQEEQRKARHELRCHRIAQRREELCAIIQQIGANMRILGLPMCDLYVRKGDGLLSEIKTKIEEVHFLKTYTIYDSLVEDLGDTPSNLDNYDTSLYPIELHEHCKRIAMKNWARQFPDKEQVLTAPELPTSLHYLLYVCRFWL